MIISRGYRPIDVPRIVETSQRCFSGTEQPPSKTLENMLSISDVWLARVGPNLAGFVIAEPRVTNAYLWMIAVDPLYRGRGLGGQLLDTVAEYYRDGVHKSVYLHVKHDNPSQRLYFQHGYRVFETAPGYYGSGTDGLGLKMRKTL